jgi:plastocyanin
MRKISGLFGALLLVLATVSCGGSTAPGGGGGGGGGGVVTPPACPANTFCLTISNTFSPTALTVAVGTTVSWRNDAGTLHNVTWNDAAGRAAALAGDGTSDIADYSTGTHTRLFNAAGVYPFHCTIHTGMAGTLTVQ